MYPENFYINHYEEIKEIKDANGNKPDMFVQLNIFDEKYDLKYDELARAQYHHWRSVETGVSELLSKRDKEILGI